MQWIPVVGLIHLLRPSDVLLKASFPSNSVWQLLFILLSLPFLVSPESTFAIHLCVRIMKTNFATAIPLGIYLMVLFLSFSSHFILAIEKNSIVSFISWEIQISLVSLLMGAAFNQGLSRVGGCFGGVRY
ncbi:hypothetical protein CDAR_504661 [Caerostris darwini]|uniref:NADH:ubiquinone reductase (H(+)-translocating) n=1 Tax=Caerostris darwini TaxID=1538125 RepID=A0AAV4SCS3_9ARAC|nr:hypothetical protein CDAR_504661 [Caerostris darwini]